MKTIGDRLECGCWVGRHRCPAAKDQFGIMIARWDSYLRYKDDVAFEFFRTAENEYNEHYRKQGVIGI